MNEKIERLQKEIEAEQRRIASCTHIFSEAKFDPETVKEPYGYQMVAQGSDVWHEPQGYHDVQKDRWSRKCEACGLVQYTYTKEPVISSYQPKFK